MKYWYDTEFIEDGKTIDLVSIGIVAEDTREFYAVSADFDVSKLCRNPWLMENVAPSLPLLDCPAGHRCIVPKHLDVDHPHVRSRGQLARAVREFLLADPGEIELWGWYPSYDHVALAQLWGTMMDKPDGIPMHTNDIQQEAERLEIEGMLPDPPPGQHNALIDARYHRDLYLFCQGQDADQRENLIRSVRSGDYDKVDAVLRRTEVL